MKPESYLVCNWNACENVSRLMQMQIHSVAACGLSWLMQDLLPLFQSSSSSTRSSLKPYQATWPPLSLPSLHCHAQFNDFAIGKIAQFNNFLLSFFFDRCKLLNNFPPHAKSIDLWAELRIKIQIHGGRGEDDSWDTDTRDLQFVSIRVCGDNLLEKRWQGRLWISKPPRQANN